MESLTAEHTLLVVLQWFYEAATENFGFIPPLHLKLLKYVSINTFL